MREWGNGGVGVVGGLDGSPGVGEVWGSDPGRFKTTGPCKQIQIGA